MREASGFTVAHSHTFRAEFARVSETAKIRTATRVLFGRAFAVEHCQQSTLLGAWLPAQRLASRIQELIIRAALLYQNPVVANRPILTTT